MAHQFSVEIHDFLSSSIEAAERELAQLGPEGGARGRYLEGRLAELRHFRELLTGKYDLRFHRYY
jgi:hypothetical protein